jgi:hypothetical protein
MDPIIRIGSVLLAGLIVIAGVVVALVITTTMGIGQGLAILAVSDITLLVWARWQMQRAKSKPRN